MTPLLPANPIRPEWYLVQTATTFIEDIWRPHILEKSRLPEHSPFELAAWAVKPYWHFIFTIGLVVSPLWEHDQSWCVHDFCFGARDVEQAIMDKIAKRYTERFKEPVDVDKATSCLHDIIVSKMHLFLKQLANLCHCSKLVEGISRFEATIWRFLTVSHLQCFQTLLIQHSLSILSI
jgi:hypothetical protein